eukprot:CAMPEP_0179308380 /NCGR_PEP_ID=MMETSP0797-20121207/51118_1 /TAXON_ID=47934 /ORGANISM="Dinophysis acuminata, Strain DAEP01" /LENGTH=366 /DNA_ID=CAMNT_0021018075 /DNA_START=73 /DNA_END=1173 /DNA_ORIENTATION=+
MTKTATANRSQANGRMDLPSRACATDGQKRVSAKSQRTPTKKTSLKRQQSRRAPRTEDKTACRRRVAPVCPALQEADEAKLVLEKLQTIVISLDRRKDRMEGCAARLNAHCPGLQFSCFSATDGRQTQIPTSEVVHSWHTARNVVYQKIRAVRKNWNDLDTYQERTLTLSGGERGCASSHIRAWRHCLELAGDTERPLLVLEDDAAPTADFTVTLARALRALPSDAHLLYLGYSQAADWRREVSPELVESEYVWTTVGYVVWPAGARLLLNKLPINEPVDNWLAGLCAGRDVKAYCVRPKIIHQADAWNVNSDVAHSDEHYWGPNSDIQHSDEFYWGAKPEDRSAEVGGLSLWGTNSDSEDSEDDF